MAHERRSALRMRTVAIYVRVAGKALPRPLPVRTELTAAVRLYAAKRGVLQLPEEP